VVVVVVVIVPFLRLPGMADLAVVVTLPSLLAQVLLAKATKEVIRPLAVLPVDALGAAAAAAVLLAQMLLIQQQQVPTAV
jgi:hypothetical protein